MLAVVRLARRTTVSRVRGDYFQDSDTHRETKIYSRVIRVKRRIMDEERGKHTAAQVSGVWGKQMEIETVTLKRDQRTPALHYTGYLVQTVC